MNNKRQRGGKSIRKSKARKSLRNSMKRSRNSKRTRNLRSRSRSKKSRSIVEQIGGFVRDLSVQAFRTGPN